MDDKSCNYSQERYNEIQGEVEKMLTKIGYKTKKIPFIPLSGFLGVNLTRKGDKEMPWYKGFSVQGKKEKKKKGEKKDKSKKKEKAPKIEGWTLVDALNDVV